MDVKLYIYDLSRGLARTFSAQLLGTHIDAVYHTSIVLDDTEYFFGAGIQTSIPGLTHHGPPMEILFLGTTEVPMDVVLEWFDAVADEYSAQSYDLFVHNCNNFTNDFSEFLVGKGIPERITSLPRQVLETPFGRMLRPQLDQAMRGFTQAKVVAPAAASNLGNVERDEGGGAGANEGGKESSSSGKHDETPL